MSAADFSPQPTWCFSVFATPEPGVMPRVLELFAKRGLTPKRVHGAVVGADDEGLVIDVQVDGLDSGTAEHIAACLRGIVAVDRVLTATKRKTASGAGAF